jgi:hypothetical protein
MISKAAIGIKYYAYFEGRRLPLSSKASSSNDEDNELVDSHQLTMLSLCLSYT